MSRHQGALLLSRPYRVHGCVRRVCRRGFCTRDTPPPPPAPPGLTYRPFQLRGIDFMARARHSILADEMGLGKTVQVIGLVNRLADSAPRPLTVLIVCPKSLVRMWADELERWLVKPIPISLGAPKEVVLPSRGEGGGVLVLNYDIVWKHRATLGSDTLDVLVCDEAHFLKNPRAKRTLAVLGETDPFGEGAEHLWGVQSRGVQSRHSVFLTGSPILNRPIELYPLVRSTDPEGVHVPHARSHEEFGMFYCDGQQTRWGMMYKGVTNAHILRKGLSGIMLRRLKEDVLTELPAKQYQVLTVTDAAAKRAERSCLATKSTRPRLPPVPSASSALSAEVLREYLGGVSRAYGVEAIFRMRKAVALHKVKHAVDLLREAEHKVVAFAHHHELIDELMRALESHGIRAVRLDGRMGHEERAASVRRFQQDPEVGVFIGSIRAAGQGITLTAASHVLFVEFDWSPEVMRQAEDRCHRIGQTESVLVQYLSIASTVDSVFARMLVKKEELIEQVLGPRTVAGGRDRPLESPPSSDSSEHR